MDWIAIVWSGLVATLVSAAFFAAVHSFGLTRFSPTVQLGCLVFENPRTPATDTLGYVLLIALGSTVVPALYLLVMNGTGGASWLSGALVGAVHGVATAAALPVLRWASACVRAGAMPPPGRFGIAWGWFTPVGVVLGHALYGGVAGAILAAF